MDLIFLLGRVIFGGFFIKKGIDHFKNKDALVGYAQSKGVGHGTCAVISTGILMVLGGLSIVVGLFFQIGFILLIIFLIPTSLIMHAYWKETDPSKKMNEKTSFMNNMALVGALLMMLAYMTGPWVLSL